MIVTCERCSTQFRLDDKRIPEQGVRVRCSRCKYAFRVERPVSSEEERIQRAAARGLEPDTPDVTQDLPDEEEDWEFNDDRPGEGEPEPGAGEASAEIGAEQGGGPLEAAVSSPGDAYGFGTGAASKSAAAPPEEAGAAPDTPSGLELGSRRTSSFDSAQAAGPFDFSGDEGAGSGLDLAGPRSAAAGLDPETFDAAAPRPDPYRHVAGAAGAPEEIGSPDKWDFFASDSSEKAPTPTRVRLTVTPPRARASRPAPISRDLIAEDLQPRSHWLERIVHSAGWLVVLAVFAGGLYGGFAHGARGSSTTSGSQQVANLRVGQVGGRWVDNLVAGDLYVVSGVVRRDPAAGDAKGSALFVTLLDAAGERLRLAPIPVGPPLPQALLRQADPAQLHGAAGQVLSPAPGAGLRVEAVIPTPPAAASAFRFVTPEELAALNVDTPVPLASDDGGDGSGKGLAPAPAARSDEPGESP